MKDSTRKSRSQPHLPPSVFKSAKLTAHSGRTVLTNIYARTSSAAYTLTLTLLDPSSSPTTLKITSPHFPPKLYTLPASATTFSVPITLLASPNNTLTIHSASSLVSVHVSEPNGTFYPATLFSVSGTARHVNCSTNLCQPSGTKTTNLSPRGNASFTLPGSPSSPTPPALPALPSPISEGIVKYVELTYTNNDVALDTSWTTGRNARNITLAVNNGPELRIEVPLSGRSSELFSPMRGWGDSAVLGALVSGGGSIGGEGDVVVVGNVGGEEGVESYGADFVGSRVF